MTRSGKLVTLRQPKAEDRDPFLAKVHQSTRLHHPWVSPPGTPEAFARYLSRCQAEDFVGLFVCTRKASELAGVINISEIVRGVFQSAYLGFYALSPLQGKGYMREGLQLTLEYCFQDLELHRLEANIQPENERSKRLVESCGFRQEGYSPKYLKIDGQWRDHERWAILAEE